MTDMSYTWDVYEICLGNVLDIDEAWLRYDLNSPMIRYNRHFWDIPEVCVICMRYTWDMF